MDVDEAYKKAKEYTDARKMPETLNLNLGINDERDKAGAVIQFYKDQNAQRDKGFATLTDDLTKVCADATAKGIALTKIHQEIRDLRERLWTKEFRDRSGCRRSQACDCFSRHFAGTLTLLLSITARTQWISDGSDVKRLAAEISKVFNPDEGGCETMNTSGYTAAAQVAIEWLARWNDETRKLEDLAPVQPIAQETRQERTERLESRADRTGEGQLKTGDPMLDFYKPPIDKEEAIGTCSECGCAMLNKSGHDLCGPCENRKRFEGV